MTPEPSSGRTPGPDRMWTDPREEEEHTPWLQPKTAITAVQKPLREEPPPPEPPRRNWLAPALGILAALLLVTFAVLGVVLLNRANDTADKVTSALPSAPGTAPESWRPASA